MCFRNCKADDIVKAISPQRYSIQSDKRSNAFSSFVALSREI